MEHWDFRHGACSCDLFLLDLSCRKKKQFVMLSFPSLQTIGMKNGILFILPFLYSSSPHMFYSKREEGMAYPDPLI